MALQTRHTNLHPLYLEQLTPTDIHARARALLEIQQRCTLCPHQCAARRSEEEVGVCHATDRVIISSVGAHFGEEPPLVGSGGSGTIFFTSCNLKCLYCQNYEISHLRIGAPMTVERLADSMMALQHRGCHNINLVTPTHYVPQIVQALALAVEKGLSIPLVYNCGGYESVETLRLLQDIVDIYMPDMKYGGNEEARTYSGASNYWDVVRPAICEMQRQVGDLSVDRWGIAQRGLIIRHLVLPHNVACTRNVLQFIAREVSHDAYVNIMDQYHPSYRAAEAPLINRRITSKEYNAALEYAQSLGLHRGFML